jgi:hypothetical protein
MRGVEVTDASVVANVGKDLALYHATTPLFPA